METFNLCAYMCGYEGETFYTPLYGEMIFDCYSSETDTPIHMEMGDDALWFQEDGSYRGFDAPCMLFPTKEYYELYPTDPKTAWEEWKKTQIIKETTVDDSPWWIPRRYDEYWFVGTDGQRHGTINYDSMEDRCRFKYGNCFKTEEDCMNMIPHVKQLYADYHSNKLQ